MQYTQQQRLAPEVPDESIGTLQPHKTPYLRRTEARRAERIDRARSAIYTADRGPQGRDNSLFRPEDGYFELVGNKANEVVHIII